MPGENLQPYRFVSEPSRIRIFFFRGISTIEPLGSIEDFPTAGPISPPERCNSLPRRAFKVHDGPACGTKGTWEQTCQGGCSFKVRKTSTALERRNLQAA